MSKRLFTIEVELEHPAPELAITNAVKDIYGVQSVTVREAFANV